jgi:hypothetical protein
MEKIRNILYGDLNPYKGFKTIEKDTQGWASESSVFKEVIDEIKPTRIIEVGSWKGASAIHMARVLLANGVEDFEIVCVDTWLGSVEHWMGNDEFKNNRKFGRPTVYDQFMSNIIHEKLTDYITPFPIDAVNAAEYFVANKIEADLVYIDAGHDYLSVRHDLIQYSKVVRVGGYMLGDDWFHQPIKDAAIDTFTADKVITRSHDKFLWIR